MFLRDPRRRVDKFMALLWRWGRCCSQVHLPTDANTQTHWRFPHTQRHEETEEGGGEGPSCHCSRDIFIFTTGINTGKNPKLFRGIKQLFKKKKARCVQKSSPKIKQNKHNKLVNVVNVQNYPSLAFLALKEFVQTARLHFAQPDHKLGQ